jgi:hypothetical protein
MMPRRPIPDDGIQFHIDLSGADDNDEIGSSSNMLIPHVLIFL